MREKLFVDVSDRSITALEGPEGLDLLQRMSTNDVAGLMVGEHRETVLTTDKGRIVDVLVVFRTSATSVLLCGTSTDSHLVCDWIEKFIVMEDVNPISLTGKRMQFLLFNINDTSIIANLATSNILAIQLEPLASKRILLVAEMDAKSEIDSFLQANAFVQASKEDYEYYRIKNRIPEFPNEINPQFNPLEIGLRPLVSFTKGCYVGQEVIARLDTYDKMNKTLMKFRLSKVPMKLPKDLFTSSEEKVGILTSCTKRQTTDEQYLGLGVVSLRVAGMELMFRSSANDLDGGALLIGDSPAPFGKNFAENEF